MLTTMNVQIIEGKTHLDCTSFYTTLEVKKEGGKVIMEMGHFPDYWYPETWEWWKEEGLPSRKTIEEYESCSLYIGNDFDSSFGWLWDEYSHEAQWAWEEEMELQYS